MERHLIDAFEEIDAAIFSGDTFSTDEDALLALKDYIGRWQRAIPALEEQLAEYLDHSQAE
jgi:hypothetical protein